MRFYWWIKIRDEKEKNDNNESNGDKWFGMVLGYVIIIIIIIIIIILLLLLNKKINL